MKTNSFPRHLLLAIFFFSGLAPFLSAQNTAGFIEIKNNEERFLQRLQWTGGEYALRFEVVVQKEVNGTYITQQREITENSFLAVSLPPGDYRYQVTSYDVLDRPEEVSQWVSFKVRPAAQGEVIEKTQEIIANDSGSDTENFSENELEDEAGRTKPLKQILLIAGLSWQPVFPLHGNIFGEDFSPAGAAARFGAAFPIPGNIFAGAEISVLWNINSDNNENALSLGVNLFAIKFLSNQRMAVNYRFGLSFFILPDTNDKLMFNIGASYLWRFTDKFFLEAGLDYAALLKGKYFNGCIRPLTGFGMIF